MYFAIQASLVWIVCRGVMHHFALPKERKLLRCGTGQVTLSSVRSVCVQFSIAGMHPGSVLLGAKFCLINVVEQTWHSSSWTLGQLADGKGVPTQYFGQLCQVLHNSDLGTPRETNRLPLPKSTLGPVVTWS